MRPPTRPPYRILPRLLPGVLALTVSACTLTTGPAPAPAPQPVPPAQPVQVKQMSASEGRAAFASVSRRVEPVAEQECRRRAPGMNCDFLIRIDPDPDAPPNAYQSLSRSGRPLITFTQKMLTQLANEDEVAFVMSHEAAHHIRGHLARQAQNAALAGAGAAVLSSLIGGGDALVATAQDVGSYVGARSYSKAHELEADELGTLITHAAATAPASACGSSAVCPIPATASWAAIRPTRTGWGWCRQPSSATGCTDHGRWHRGRPGCKTSRRGAE